MSNWSSLITFTFLSYSSLQPISKEILGKDFDHLLSCGGLWSRGADGLHTPLMTHKTTCKGLTLFLSSYRYPSSLALFTILINTLKLETKAFETLNPKPPNPITSKPKYLIASSRTKRKTWTQNPKPENTQILKRALNPKDQITIKPNIQNNYTETSSSWTWLSKANLKST